MSDEPPLTLNIAGHFLDQRVEEGLGDRRAVLCQGAEYSYAQVQRLANRYAHLLHQAGVRNEERVLIALPDGIDFVGAFFGTLKLGAVVVMVNPELKPDALRYFLEYTRARAALIHREHEEAFHEAAEGTPHLLARVVVGTDEHEPYLNSLPDLFENFPTHRDDPAIWLFSGGTTGHPKAVVQPHRSFWNTTECYAKQVLRYTRDDVTMAVPKLYFGYATGSNLLFPFAAGAATALFPERCTADTLFEQIARYRPTILINVPTMIQNMVSHPKAGEQDLSCLRLATSAGEALPEPLHQRWNELFGVEILDGLGTAEMWHVFLSNRPGDVHPGTLGRVVPGFDVRVRDDDGRDLPDGEVGWLWVKGMSRAIAYWQQMEKTQAAFRGDWYVSGDMVRRDADGVFTYCGRGDDMLKVSGKWLSPKEVEDCLAQHPAVKEIAVIGVADANGLVKPHACLTLRQPVENLAAELKAFANARMEPYKYPREVHVYEDLPRTHLGKIDRGALRRALE